MTDWYFVKDPNNMTEAFQMTTQDFQEFIKTKFCERQHLTPGQKFLRFLQGLYYLSPLAYVFHHRRWLLMWAVWEEIAYLRQQELALASSEQSEK